ncbi:hypothetical protein HZQ04_15655 [Elizabethkingia anophelis]|nr:hypothetical protein [Elizabethkingia anophelis]
MSGITSANVKQKVKHFSIMTKLLQKIEKPIRWIKAEEYNKAIRDINNQNFADYCNVNFDRVQLEFDTDWSVYYDEKGNFNLLWCEDKVCVLNRELSVKVYEFLKEKKDEI